MRNNRHHSPFHFWLALALIAPLTFLACSSTPAEQAQEPPPQGEPTVEPTTAPPKIPTPTPESSVTPTPTVQVPVRLDADGFNDHTVASINSTDEFFALANRSPDGTAAVKFTIPNMLADNAVNFADSNFYALHDEWYWFRLLNGKTIPNSDATVYAGEQFATVEAIYERFSDTPPGDLPLDLRWTDSASLGRQRLYSNNFYSLGLHTDPRNYGLGTVIYRPADGDLRERWLFELEYSDDVNPIEMVRFFEVLGARLPTEIADALEWVVRSPTQEALAVEMQTDEAPYADQIVRYSELVRPGTVAVYNEGITAGRLLLIEDGRAELTDSTADRILLVDTVPDWLPPAAALISSAPQTPLAHVNLLARNRGIPNASQAGVLFDAEIRQAARGSAYAIVRAEANTLEIELITKAQYEEWVNLQSRSAISVPYVDPASVPMVINLTDIAPTIGSDTDLDPWRLTIGGKATGFLSLLTAGVTTPETPLAVSTAPYLEHLALVSRELNAMLEDPKFGDEARLRYLLLEGPSDYADVYADTNDVKFARDYTASHPAGSPLGDILAAGGFKALFRAVPITAQTLAQIESELETTFGRYPEGQGLRFRSSSTVEDIEGFSGAGLYDSNTGYLHPESQPEKDQKRTIEWAIKKTWASYWGVEAFEERNLENVEHRSGAMALLVHARFDDEHEINNGVATLTLLPTGQGGGALLTINTQRGAVSVTNPDPTDFQLPEIIEVRSANESVTITRLAESTIPGGAAVLGDTTTTRLFDDLFSIAILWRERLNVGLATDLHRQVITLDFEFKTMAGAWSGSATNATQLVIKQARSLDPGRANLPEVVTDLSIPEDLLVRSVLIQRVSCAEDSWIEVYSDPLASPDMGYTENPFTIGSRPDGASASQDGCSARQMYRSADQYLLQLLEASE